MFYDVLFSIKVFKKLKIERTKELIKIFHIKNPVTVRLVNVPLSKINNKISIKQ